MSGGGGGGGGGGGSGASALVTNVRQNRLFDQFVEFQMDVDLADPQRSELRTSYVFDPHRPANAHAQQFCYPEGPAGYLSYVLALGRKQDRFVFTLTDVDGVRLNGFVRRFYVAAVPVAHCVFTHPPWYLFWFDFLDTLAVYLERDVATAAAAAARSSGAAAP